MENGEEKVIQMKMTKKEGRVILEGELPDEIIPITVIALREKTTKIIFETN